MTFEALFDKRPTPEYPRSSEGDFALLPDGRILFAYSLYHDDRDDFAPCNIGGLFSDDGGRTFSQTPIILISAAILTIKRKLVLTVYKRCGGLFL